MVQKILIHRTATPNNPPSGLSPGELSVEMADPLNLWVGVPTSIDPSGKRLLVKPYKGPVLVDDNPPANPDINQLWWESDTGILFLWYNDGNSSQWVQVSKGGAAVDLPEPPPDAHDIPFTPGGTLSADDVQEALLELDTEKVAKNGDTMTGLLILSGDPTNVKGAATKQYVDGQIAPINTALATKIGDSPHDGNTYGRNNGIWVAVSAGGGGTVASGVTFTPAGNVAANNVQTAIQEVDAEKLALAGGTMTGTLTLAADPTAALQAVTKQYADSKFVDVVGDTMTGDLTMGAGATANSPAIRLKTTTGNNALIQKQAGNLYLYAQEGASGVILDPNGNLSIPAPTQPSHATTKTYVDNAITTVTNTANNKVSKTGDTMTGVLNIGGTAPGDNQMVGPFCQFLVSGYLNCNIYYGSGNWKYLTNGFGMLLCSDGAYGMVMNVAPNGGAGAVVPSWGAFSFQANGWLTLNNGRLNAPYGAIFSPDQAFKTQCDIGGGVHGTWRGIEWFGSGGTVTCQTRAFADQWFEIYSCPGGFAAVASDGGLQISGSVAAKPGGGTWYDSSDGRIKTITGDYKAGLDEVLTLNPIRYVFRGNDTLHEPEGEKAPYDNSAHKYVARDKTEFIGLIAQSVEDKIPDMVKKTKGYIDGLPVDDLRTLDTTPLIFALVNAVKTLAARVAELEAKVS